MADTQQPRAPGGNARRLLPGTGDVLENLPRVREVGPAGLGQVDAMVVADEEVEPKLALELADLPAQRRLGDVEPLGSAAEVQLVGNGNEVAEMPELHTRRKWCVQVSCQMRRLLDTLPTASGRMAPASQRWCEDVVDGLEQRRRVHRPAPGPQLQDGGVRATGA